MQKQVVYLNSPVPIKEIEFVTKSLFTKTQQSWVALLVIQTLRKKKVIPILLSILKN